MKSTSTVAPLADPKRPPDAAALAQQSMLADRRGDYDLAVRLARKALKLAPQTAQAQNSLGILLAKLEQAPLARKCFERAIQAAPEEPHGYLNLGKLLLDRFGRPDQASDLFEKALRAAPESQLGYFGLCCALVRQGPLDRVLGHLHRLRAVMPNRHRAYFNTVEALMREGRHFEAKACCLEALKLQREDGETHALLGELAFVFREAEEAVMHYRSAVRLSPGSPSVVSGLLRALAGMGRFEEARKAVLAAGNLFPLRDKYRYRPWSGEPLEGKTLLLKAARGNGDAIQFARYTALAKERGARVIVQSPASLRALLLTVPGIDSVTSPDEPPPQADYEFDFELLGLHLGMDLETAGRFVPYLFPDEAIRSEWGRRLGERKQLRVCLSWSGQLLWESDPYRQRAIPLRQLGPIFTMPEVSFFTVQKGRGAKEIQEHAAGLMTDMAAGDYLDNAAALTHMDLVISNDSSIAHLAGALGVRTWVLLPYSADWRWQLDREDSPWYPGMLLFRQQQPGDWSDPVNAACAALRKLAPAEAAVGVS